MKSLLIVCGTYQCICFLTVHPDSQWQIYIPENETIVIVSVYSIFINLYAWATQETISAWTSIILVSLYPQKFGHKNHWLLIFSIWKITGMQQLEKVHDRNTYIYFLTYLRQRAASILSWGQFTTRLACPTLRLSIRTHNILGSQCRSLLKPVHDHTVPSQTLPWGHLTFCVFRTAVFTITAAHSLNCNNLKTICLHLAYMIFRGFWIFFYLAWIWFSLLFKST